ncbi:hypothetical protein D3C80_2161400 [compost metagenome]
MALLGSLAVPGQRLLPILRYSMAIQVSPAKIELCISISLLSSLEIPSHRLLIILFHYVAIRVPDA